MTIEELIEHLDGNGLVVTDSDLIQKALHPLGLAPFDDVIDRDRVVNHLALYFTPDAIRGHFESDNDEIAEAVAAASDEQLREVGQWCLDADTLYQTFHELLVDGVSEMAERQGRER